MQLVIHTDGGARGNPGPAAVGVAIEECQCVSASVCHEKKRKEIVSFGKLIGETTNNVAEYCAVIAALQEIKNQKYKIKKFHSTSSRHADQGSKMEIQFYLDSTLVVNQINGLFKVKDATLRQLLSQVRILEQEIGGAIRYHYVPREYNHRADLLVNKALDENS